MRALLALGALTLIALVGCGAQEGALAPVPDESYEGVLPASAQDPLADAEAATIEGIAVQVPASWSSSDHEGALCIQPPGRDGCRYGALLVYPHAAERQGNNWPSDHFDRDNGWAAGQRQCRAEGADGGVSGAQLETQDFTDHADGLTSHHSVWQVNCENGDGFEVRLWYLPESDVAVYAWAVDPGHAEAYDEIARSMDTGEYGG